MRYCVWTRSQEGSTYIPGRWGSELVPRWLWTTDTRHDTYEAAEARAVELRSPGPRGRVRIETEGIWLRWQIGEGHVEIECAGNLHGAGC